jgi:hypothetical protein
MPKRQKNSMPTQLNDLNDLKEQKDVRLELKLAKQVKGTTVRHAWAFGRELKRKQCSSRRGA